MENEIDIPRGIIKQDSIAKTLRRNKDIPFHIPEEAKVPGMEYRWIATTLTKYGKEVMQENLEEAASRGWLPISRSRNPGLMNETRDFYSFDDYIMEQAHLLSGRLINKQLECDSTKIEDKRTWLEKEQDRLLESIGSFTE